MLPLPSRRVVRPGARATCAKWQTSSAMFKLSNFQEKSKFYDITNSDPDDYHDDTRCARLRRLNARSLIFFLNTFPFALKGVLPT
jgi:hypothetical protein